MSVQSTQPNFNHPELVVKTVPIAKWRVQPKISAFDNGDVHLHYLSKGGTMTRTVFLNSSLEKLEEHITNGLVVQILYHKDFTREVFFEGNGRRCYSRKIRPSGEVREKWFSDLGSKVIASRNTINGKLSRTTHGPAVSIQRPNGIRRDEYWVNGILSQVFLVDPNTSKVLARQAWKDGKRAYQTTNFEAMENGPSPGSKSEAEPPKPSQAVSLETPEKKTPEKKTFNLISAEEARGALKQDDERIQEILDAFETQRREGAPRGERRFNIKMNYRLEERVTKLFKEAGYHVNVNLPYYWVEF